MSSLVTGAATVPRRVHILGILSIVSGAILGLAAFAWLAGVGVTQTAWLAPPRSAMSAAAPRPAAGLVERSDNRGQVLFGRYCDSCHPGGREGLGSDLEGTQVKRQYTSEDKIIKKVRSGGFELDMPVFPKSLISDEDLATLATYVLNLPAQAH
jgi:mono/diheme cytochrome c family protein